MNAPERRPARFRLVDDKARDQIALNFGVSVLDRRGGFLALVWIPGRRPQFVADHRGDHMRFPDEDAARLAGFQAMFEAMNRRLYGSANFEQEPMPPEDLAVALDAIGITPYDFAFVLGLDPREDLRPWMNGTRPIPHWVRIVVDHWTAHPDLYGEAQAATEAVTTRKPREGDHGTR